MELKKTSANGIEISYLVKGEGPLLLCLHGFPDHAHTFEAQIDYFSDAGYKVIAPFMRGYAPSSTPDCSQSFQTAILGKDVIALLERFTDDKAYVFGHDWGATAAYGAAIMAPEKIEKLITAAVPFGPQFPMAFLNSFAQQKRSWYMFFFQTALAEMAVPLNDYQFIKDIWKDWSPDWDCPPEYINSVITTLSTGNTLSCALEYYRQTFTAEKHSPDLASIQQKMSIGPIHVPAIYIQGLNDGCIGAEQSQGMEKCFTEGFEVYSIPNAGHFMHLEKPDEINQIIEKFINS